MIFRFLAAGALVLALAPSAGAAPRPGGQRQKLLPPPASAASVLAPHSNWICDDGQTASIRYDAATGIIEAQRGAERWTLQEQVGVSPRRFVSGNDTAALDGDMVELKRGRQVRSTCTLVPDAPVEGRIWGTLALPAGASPAAGSKVKVLLVDAARADSPAIELAATRFTTRGNQPPFAYLLQFEPEKAAPRPMTYRLQARIENAAGKLLFITDTATFVLENSAATPPVALDLVAVKN